MEASFLSSFFSSFLGSSFLGYSLVAFLDIVLIVFSELYMGNIVIGSENHSIRSEGSSGLCSSLAADTGATSSAATGAPRSGASTASRPGDPSGSGAASSRLLARSAATLCCFGLNAAARRPLVIAVRKIVRCFSSRTGVGLVGQGCKGSGNRRVRVREFDGG
jgi:hypothetical protein